MDEMTLTAFVGLMGLELTDWQRELVEKIESSPTIRIVQRGRRIKSFEPFSPPPSKTITVDMLGPYETRPSLVIVDELDEFDFPTAMKVFDKHIDDARKRRDGTVTSARRAKRDFIHKNLTK